MNIKRRFWSALMPVALMVVAPTALAQVHSSDAIQAGQAQPAEIIQLAEAKTSQEQPPASWRGKKVALRGRDVVSFHGDSGPVKGSKQFTTEWDDTTWRFASEKNRDAFKVNPRKYIPEFGGYCPVALSRGEVKIGRTNQFTRIDDKLYLNYNRARKREFGIDPDAYIVKAQVSW